MYFWAALLTLYLDFVKIMHFFSFFNFWGLEINFRQLVLLAHLILSLRPFQPCVTHACTQKFIFCHIVIYVKRGRGAFGGLRGKSRMEKKFRKKISGLLGCQGTSHLMCACQLKKSVILKRPTGRFDKSVLILYLAEDPAYMVKSFNFYECFLY